jgi:hypothetical protein
MNLHNKDRLTYFALMLIYFGICAFGIWAITIPASIIFLFLSVPVIDRLLAHRYDDDHEL